MDEESAVTGYKGRFYIVGSRKEPERAKRWMDAMVKEGWLNTHDWTLGLPPEHRLSDDETTQKALLRVQALLMSELVWVLVPEDGDVDAFSEIGIEIGANRLAQAHSIEELRLVVSGPHASSTFSALAEARFDTDEQAFDHLTGW